MDAGLQSCPASKPTPDYTRALLIVLAVALLLRLVQLSFAVGSPLTYQLGPDEEYYLAFGRDVAFGSGGLRPEFAFMDPLYGYLLGAMLWLTGGTVFVVYLVQALVDTATAWLIYLIGRRLADARVALGAALLYALTATAVMYATTLLKATWVMAFAALWMWAALRALDAGRRRAWLGFGLLCGLGVALRGNLLLLAALGLLAPWLAWRRGDNLGRAGQHCLAVLAGLLLALAPWSLRNLAVSGSLSPLPNNGGIVLHQLYHPDNPRALNAVPGFVGHAHPAEIWRGYAREAERRLGRALDAGDIDAYWRGQALSHLRERPGRFAGNLARKTLEFAAGAEVPNNRSLADERRFSPLLRALPNPFGALFALGVPGLILLIRRDRRAWVLWAPVAVSLVTFVVFFAESRFRLAAAPALALGTAALIAALIGWGRARQWRPMAVAGGAALALALLSVLVSATVPRPAFNWQRAAWGYIQSGRIEPARALVRQAAAKQPDAAGLLDFEGYFALAEQRFDDARRAFQASLAQRPGRHEIQHNLSLALEGLSDLPGAIAAERQALALAPLPEYRRRLTKLEARRVGAPAPGT